MTELCNLMKTEGSDKGDSWHNYTTVYSDLFDDIRDDIQHVFEVGIGTNNPAFQSHMQPQFTPGGSLRGWQKYFPNATICGADIDRDILFEEERIRTFHLDQTNMPSIHTMINDNELTEKMFDIILDDGLHTLPAAMSMFINFNHMLAEDGIYIIEDVQRHEVQNYIQNLKYASEQAGFKLAILDIPHHHNNVDNILFVFIREGCVRYDNKLETIMENFKYGN